MRNSFFNQLYKPKNQMVFLKNIPMALKKSFKLKMKLFRGFLQNQEIIGWMAAVCNPRAVKSWPRDAGRACLVAPKAMTIGAEQEQC